MRIALLVLSALSLSGCAARFVPTYGQPPEQQAADTLECRAVSEGLSPAPQGGGFFVAGSPQFVRNATIGYAAGSALAGIAHAAVVADNYNLCMVAHGYAKAPN